MLRAIICSISCLKFVRKRGFDPWKPSTTLDSPLFDLVRRKFHIILLILISSCNVIKKVTIKYTALQVYDAKLNVNINSAKQNLYSSRSQTVMIIYIQNTYILMVLSLFSTLNTNDKLTPLSICTCLMHGLQSQDNKMHQSFKDEYPLIYCSTLVSRVAIIYIVLSA